MDDLERRYWQVKLNPFHKKYIGVSLDGKYYIANVLIWAFVMLFLLSQNCMTNYKIGLGVFVQ